MPSAKSIDEFTCAPPLRRPRIEAFCSAETNRGEADGEVDERDEVEKAGDTGKVDEVVATSEDKDEADDEAERASAAEVGVDLSESELEVEAAIEVSIDLLISGEAGIMEDVSAAEPAGRRRCNKPEASSELDVAVWATPRTDAKSSSAAAIAEKEEEEAFIGMPTPDNRPSARP